MKRLFLLAAWILLTAQARAATILVKNLEELNAANKTAVPGDTILLQNGEWRDVLLRLDCKGTQENPITVRAQTAGKVQVCGNSKLRIGGAYIIVEGIHFVNGYAGRDAVIAFRTDKDQLANHCRVTNCAITGFNNAKRLEENTWIALYGKHNRIDHCSFTDKKNLGVLLAVMLDDDRSRENNHIIEYNYFGKRLPLASNGGEIIRVGLSQHCQYNSNTQIRDNLFEKCDGEAEVISIKSGSNRIEGNIFKECQGALVLRHGNNNHVLNNTFLGNDKTETGGVRVINKGQKIIGNYFYKCRGTGFRSPLTIMNGIPNSPANRYVQVSDAEISRNVFVECSPMSFCEGSDTERTLPPFNVTMAMNSFYNTRDSLLFVAYDKIDGIRFLDNQVTSPLAKSLPGGFSLSRASKQKPVPSYSLKMYGAAWLVKVLNTGTAIKRRVDCPDAASVYKELEKRQPLRIRLTGKGYIFSRPAIISSDIEIEGIGKSVLDIASATEIPAVFIIKADGSLRFSKCQFVAEGVKAKDFIRGDSSGSSGHYSFIFDRSSISGLKTTHFLFAPQSFVADSIVISNSTFKNCRTNLLSANEEKEEKGYYSIERVIMYNNEFERIFGSLVDLYRGGRDESTLGPSFLFSNNSIRDCTTDVGANALISLTGVQVSLISANDFSAHTLDSELIIYKDLSRAKHRLEKNLLPAIARILANSYVTQKDNVVR